MLKKIKYLTSVAESASINASETNSMMFSISLRVKRKEKPRNNSRKLNRNFNKRKNLPKRRINDKRHENYPKINLFKTIK